MTGFGNITREDIIFLIMVGVVIGVVIGLIPLIYGRKKGTPRLGLIGFLVSIVAGALWSILPLFVMIGFVFLIQRNKPAAEIPKATEAAAEEARSDD